MAMITVKTVKTEELGVSHAGKSTCAEMTEASFELIPAAR